MAHRRLLPFLGVIAAILAACGMGAGEGTSGPRVISAQAAHSEPDRDVTYNRDEGVHETDGGDEASRVVSLGEGPYYTDDILLVYTSGFGEGNGRFLAYRWYVNGSPVTDALDASLSGFYFERGDEVYVEASRLNGPSDRSWVRSNVVIIANSRPVVASVNIHPTFPTRADVLTASAAATDADGDPVSVTYVWWSGTRRLGDGESTSCADLMRGSAVTVVATPFDEFEAGASARGGPVTIQNSAPSVTGVTLRLPLVSGEALRAEPHGWHDVDDDPPGCRCEWFVNGNLVVGETGPILSRTHVRRGDTVRVDYEAFDGIQSGNLVESETALIPNAAPTAPSIELAPSAVSLVTSAIWVVIYEHAVDGDGDPVTYAYRWTYNGEEQDFPASQTIVTLPFSHPSDEWSVTVTPFDQAGAGEPAFASSADEKRTIAVVTGASHTCALSVSGAVFCWGSNTYGQLGDPTTRFSTRPVAVRGLRGGVMAIAASGEGSCALTTAGAVYCWGAVNLSPSLSVATSPLRIPDLPLMKNIDGGSTFFCGSTVDDQVMCWGSNINWRGSIPGTPSRGIEVAAHFSERISDVAAGFVHICVLLESGSVQCWGNGNAYGQLGDGTTVVHASPQTVALPAQARRLDVSASSSCAVVSGGAVLCWGADNVGGGSRAVLTPTPVSLPAAALGVGVAVSHKCALLETKEVYCWGHNLFAQLGHGHHRPLLGPIAVALNDGAIDLATSSLHTCVLIAAGSVRCWGENHDGQMGNGDRSVQTRPVPVNGHETGTRQIALGYSHTCTLDEAGATQCFGSNEAGQLGHDAAPDQWIPAAVPAITEPVTRLWARNQQSCALLRSGRFGCWGEANRSQPAPWKWRAIDLPSSPRQLAFGYGYVCAVDILDRLYCWGKGVPEPDGSTFWDSATPRFMLSGVQQADGNTSSLCVLSSGIVSCWGRPGTSPGLVGPRHDIPFSRRATALAAGANYLCALLESGSVECLGWGAYGGLGDGNNTQSSLPLAVPLTLPAVAIASGSNHTCALDTDGTVVCWGQTWYGQKGDGTYSFSWEPARVATLPGSAVWIAAGGTHTCAVLATGRAMCWGYVGDGQLGNADLLDQAPSPVVGFRGVH